MRSSSSTHDPIWTPLRRMPLSGEVGYDYPDGYESYWRGRITGLEVVGQ